MIRTLKFALRYDPFNSWSVGYHATQTNAAYNHAVDVLNREPELPKRSGRNHPDALNKRVTAWRQANRQKPMPPTTSTSRAPRKPGKQTNACVIHVRNDSSVSLLPSPTMRNPSTAICGPTGALCAIAHVNAGRSV